MRDIDKTIRGTLVVGLPLGNHPDSSAAFQAGDVNGEGMLSGAQAGIGQGRFSDTNPVLTPESRLINRRMK